MKMTRKDYVLLSEVFNMTGFVTSMKGVKGRNEGLMAETAYFTLLRRLINLLKAEHPKFDADKFMRDLG